MEKYYIFAMQRYYPGGGMDDLAATVYSMVAAKEYVNGWETSTVRGKPAFLHVYDAQQERVIYKAEFDEVDRDDVSTWKLEVEVEIGER